MDDQERSRDRPFIAMSLSGGGARAAGYHLGTLAYLDRIGLLQHVEVLSAVSGGSLLGVRYAYCIKKGMTFDEFFRSTYEMLQELELMQTASEKLRLQLEDPSSRRGTLAAAMADAYDEHVTPGARFGLFWDDEPEIHLKDITFNAVEFHHGKFFRFRYSDLPYFLIGNRDVWIDHRDARRARLADVLAASGCLPLMMEPLNFPGDFAWEDAEQLEGARRRLGDEHRIETLPLMDGGVYDNQGIESLTLALEQRQEGAGSNFDLQALRKKEKRSDRQCVGRLRELIRSNERLALIVISDVPVTSQPVYQEPDTTHSTLSIRQILTWLKVVFALGVGIGVLQLVDLLTRADGDGGIAPGIDFSFWNLLLDLPPLLLVGAVLVTLFKAWRAWRGALRAAKKEGISLAGLERLRVEHVAGLVARRVASLWSLVNEVFMNRIRSLGYSLLYEDERHHHRIIAHDIGNLERTYASRRDPDREGPEIAHLIPTEAMLRVHERVETMSLKFGYEDGQLDDLIACGQMTMCHDLIAYIDAEWAAGRQSGGERPGGTISQLIEVVYKDALNDYERFREEGPRWMLEEQLSCKD